MSNRGRSTGMCPSVCVLQCVCPGINTVCVPWDKYMPVGRRGVIGLEREKGGSGKGVIDILTLILSPI